MDRISLITLALAKKFTKSTVAALEQVVRYVGVTTTAISDGSTTNPITINGQSYTAVNGDTVFYNGTSYAWDGSAWQEVMNIAEIITAVEALGGKVHDILGDIAPVFDITATYAVDDVVLYEDDLYVFTSAHTGAWDSGDVSVTTLADIIADVRSEFATALSAKQDILPLTVSGNNVTFNGHVLDGLGNDLASVASLEVSASGNPIIVNAVDVAAKELVETLEPIQDLHGYDHPWAGGAGKNKLPMTVAGIKAANTSGTWSGNVYTLNNHSFKVNDDCSIMITSTGTASSTFLFVLFLPQSASDFSTLIGKSLIINGCTNGSGSTFMLQASRVGTQDGSGGSVYATTGNKSFTWLNDGSGTMPNVAIAIESGAQIPNNTTIKPMIRLSTESDSTFAPYSNICPISGRTGTTVTTRNEDNTETASATISFGTTVYGGQVDFKTGRVRVTHEIYDMGDILWNYYPAKQYFYSAFAGYGAPKPASGVLPNLISSCYKTVNTSNDTNIMDGKDSAISYYVPSNAFQVVVKDTRYTDASALATALSGQTVCFDLATPTELTLTPAELMMLKGYNYITGDGIIDLVYVPDSISGYAESILVPISMLGTNETGRTTASRAYTTGEYFYKDQKMYKATTSIASGATFTVGTNCAQTTLFAELKAAQN